MPVVAMPVVAWISVCLLLAITGCRRQRRGRLRRWPSGSVRPRGRLRWSRGRRSSMLTAPWYDPTRQCGTWNKERLLPGVGECLRRERNDDCSCFARRDGRQLTTKGAKCKRDLSIPPFRRSVPLRTGPTDLANGGEGSGGEDEMATRQATWVPLHLLARDSGGRCEGSGGCATGCVRSRI